MSNSTYPVILPPPRNIHLLEKNSYDGPPGRKGSGGRALPVRVAREKWAGDFHAISEGYRVSGLFFVETGYGWFQVDGETYKVRGPQVFLYPRGRPRRFWCRQTNPWQVWILELDMSDAALTRLAHTDAGTWKAPELHSLFRQAYQLASLGEWDAVGDYATVLLRELNCRCMMSAVPPNAAEQLASDFEGLLATADLRDLTSMAEVARRLGVSTRKLGDACRATKRPRPGRMLNKARMWAAETYMASGYTTVNEVGTAFGYADGFSFSKAFKRTLGYAPTCAPTSQ